MNSKPNFRAAKIHRTYTVKEAAGLLGVHRNTIRVSLRLMPLNSPVLQTKDATSGCSVRPAQRLCTRLFLGEKCTFWRQNMLSQLRSMFSV